MQAVLAKDAPTYRSFTTRAMSYDTWRISTYDEWMNMYERHVRMHSKLSFLVRDGIAAQR